jgi:hypothetical protein
MKNWKTTVTGALAIVVLLSNAAILLLDGNPLTTPDYGILLPGLLAGLTGLFAKDSNVTGGTVQQ